MVKVIFITCILAGLLTISACIYSFLFIGGFI